MYQKPYLDACVYIAAIKGPTSNEPKGQPDTAIQILQAAENEAFPIHASTWLAAEIIRPGKGNAPFGQSQDQKIDAFLMGAVTWVEVDLSIAMAARQASRALGLKPADAVHLATAVSVGCDEFLTWNTKDFTTGQSYRGVQFQLPYLVGQQVLTPPPTPGGTA
jgi:predicted nucleic acid-binding protein